ncbi:alpha/beta-hydrolase [Mytilinidion resinicola]|uniref:Alpha/beta-hydrolase n=1 Tax=Mytilinidion resinicola TaxID=574789 RepID=A0A6A6XZF1_9PEZI|nr:alpha/beta-hydrolase [Mytilinidion resinicola]KAF2801355.1 alpha/beta-hydrolase [Mytilinidion resinicola]
MSTGANTDSTPSANTSLPFDSINPTGKPTILLIHGSFSTGHDWDPVIFHLRKTTTYHILAPDLPAHGRASALPFTVASASSHLATLITNEAHDGKAHIVGLSMGAYVAAHLASHYPDCCPTVFATGFNIRDPSPSFLAPIAPSVFWGMQSATDLLPRSVVEWAIDADLPVSQKGVVTKALCAEILKMLEPASVKENVGVVRARMLVVAAMKSGIVPSGDRVEDARGVVELAREGAGTGEIRVVKHAGMRHAWNRQDPDLFARAVVAWVERAEVVEGFEDV